LIGTCKRSRTVSFAILLGLPVGAAHAVGLLGAQAMASGPAVAAVGPLAEPSLSAPPVPAALLAVSAIGGAAMSLPAPAAALDPAPASSSLAAAAVPAPAVPVPSLAGSAPADAVAQAPAPADGAAAAGAALPPAQEAAKPAPAVAGAAPAAAEAAPAAEAAAQAEEANLWSRIRRGFKMPDLTGKRAQSSTRWYAGQPEYIGRMASRASRYLYHIVEEIEKRGMPTELALLPFVESGMQPEAVSWAKAAGLWQFIPSTGKKYSLEQNLWKDERFGVVESTRAALDYLQALYAEFGDWQLALAAYNCGEAGVERALARARAAHRSVAYSDLRLPTETQYYVPKLQAIKNIVSDPQRFGIALPEIANEPYFVSFNKLLDIDVATAARLADMPIEEFRELNPAFNRPVIVGASSPNILVPADKADAFEANLAAWQATGQPLASWTAYQLQRGETLAQVAQRVGVTEAQLRSANHIPPRYRAAGGSTILVPRDETMNDDIAPGFVDAAFSLEPEGANLRQITYRVRRGDTLASVARRWGVSADDIVSWNQLNTMTLFTGQRLNLTVAAPSRGAPAHHGAKKKAPAASTAGAKAAKGAAPAARPAGTAAPAVAAATRS
jgi:membrane-bound lytic murein transglycosylase D